MKREQERGTGTRARSGEREQRRQQPPAAWTRKLYLDAYKSNTKRTSIYLPASTSAAKGQEIESGRRRRKRRIRRGSKLLIYTYIFTYGNANDDDVEVGAACFMPPLQL